MTKNPQKKKYFQKKISKKIYQHRDSNPRSLRTRT